MTAPRTYAEVDGFVTMLLAACDDARMGSTLETILEQPDRHRRAIVTSLLDHMRNGGAPKDLCDAFVCLLDDRVAERAYEVVYGCRSLRANSTVA